MHEPLVSIIIPAYNVASSIVKCLNSVYAKKKKKIEVIVVNDGSTDATLKLLRELHNEHNDLCIINQDNRGLSGARNAGLDYASGDYIFFLDSDDYIGSFEIEMLVKRAVETDADMVVGGMMYVSPTGEITQSICDASRSLDKRSYWNRVYGNADGSSVEYIVSCGKLYKAFLFENVRFALGKIHEDEFIIHHLVSQCSLIEVLNCNQLFYVQNDTSITHRPSPKSTLDATEAFLLRNQFFFEAGYTDLFWASLCQTKAALISARKVSTKACECLRWKDLKRKWNRSFRRGCRFFDVLNRNCISSCAYFFIPGFFQKY